MTLVDLLSDTVYRERAVQRLDRLVTGNEQFPVETAQIYGLRQIARQQPGKVKDFANHQRERAQELQAEVDFWTLVAALCSESADWSVHEEGKGRLPGELRNIPESRPGMTNEDRRHRNQLRDQRRGWLRDWDNEHIPAFFERFCTHALYRQGMAENAR